jgi:predicted Zn finger-like uncharacterized protein
MYVQCERCQAEYEFDDALVSERGTTVKCTTCGHQFKIRRVAGAGEGDRWVVVAESGQQHVFGSLKELQKAIIARTVSKGDQLSRSGLPPKPLSSIAELEPFFEERRQRNPSIPGVSRPPPPLPPGAPNSLGPPRGPTRSDPGRTGSRPSIPPPGAPAPRINTIRPSDALPPPANAASLPPEATPPPAPLPWSAEDTPTHALRREPAASHPGVSASTSPGVTSRKPPPPPPPRNSRNPSGTPRPTPAPPRPPPREPELSSPLPPATSDAHRISASDALRGSTASLVDSRYSQPAGRRVGGWVVGVALIAGVAAVGLYMTNRTTGATTTAGAPTDPRTQQFLSAGEAALAQGNLDLAKENFDKASALAERNPDVLLAQARLTAARADLAWLRQKILLPESDDARAARQQLDELATAARRAADDAQKGAPEDAALIRARIDALRIAGDVKGARGLVDKILPTGSQPETAYVLATLDLAETDPPWSVVISRLRAAAAGEGTGSRARAALVYALARSGDVAEARKELDRLAAQPRIHPLLAPLRAFVDRAGPATADAGAPIAAKSGEPLATVDINKLPTQQTGTPGPQPPAQTPGSQVGPHTSPNTGTGTASTSGGNTGGGTSTASGPLPSDSRTLLKLADQAKGKRDLDRAKTLYEAALAKNPADSEAITGLGDVTRAQGDVAAAQGLYKRAIGVNPSYLPALIALADVQWDQGDKAGAQKAYRDIVDRFPEPAFPARVKQRAEGN